MNDTIEFSGVGTELAVTNRDASTTLYFATSPGATDEVQTITLTAGDAADTFDLTFNGTESTTAVTIPAGGYANVTAALIQACFNTIADVAEADRPVVAEAAGSTWTVTWSTGKWRGRNTPAITITSKTGAADGSVAETTPGGITSAADNTYVVLPLQTKTVPWSRTIVSVVGSGNAYSVEIA